MSDVNKETYMMTMKMVIMILRTPNALDGKVVAYVEKEPTIPATLLVLNGLVVGKRAY
jgi:hypothetical protein